ncbi:hypothetical protein ACHAWF_000108, partial [Thalassiosira exigua]
MSKRRVRLSFILPPIIIALGVSIPPLPLQMYNETLHFSCTLTAYPSGCEAFPDIDCIRGQGASTYWDAFVVYCIICNVIIVASVGLLTWTVFSQERKTDKYLTKGQEKMR